jgi:CBS domain-containing protein/uncharacterized membrane protein
MKHDASKSPTEASRAAMPPSTAGEIMTTDVISARLGTSVRDVALILLEKRVSAVPVLAGDQRLVGMVSEGDLLGRDDADRLVRRDWWLAMLKEGRWTAATSLEEAVARPVDDVMRAPVMTIDARAPLHEIAEMLRLHDIKRLPVMRGERMVGIVSRSDLLRAMASKPVPAPSDRSGSGLLSLFAGMMQTYIRPEDASALALPLATADPPAVTAKAFRSLVTASKDAERNDAMAAKQQAKLDRQRQVKALLAEHLDKHVWATLLERAHHAATLGEKSFELFRFPCDLCSDGSRKIDVAEPDWPTTLRGEAAEIFARWERELRPAGFGLTAQIVEYLDGMPANVALCLTWSPND